MQKVTLTGSDWECGLIDSPLPLFSLRLAMLMREPADPYFFPETVNFNQGLEFPILELRDGPDLRFGSATGHWIFYSGMKARNSHMELKLS